ncbi:hypothetical protein [uncultured Flavobacterium sp.]|uniref:toxin-antitoxin system YwqK family antitoxin n=1 Tax=uncultured Flavobacterium sp. TaxID=165435 RepID=UPI0030CA2E9D
MKALILFFVFTFFSYSQEKINQFDANGDRHGLWKGLYKDSKKPRYEGVFEHGKETLIFNYFDDTKEGKVIATRDFSKGNDSCFVTLFDRKNNIVSQGLLIGKLYEGEWNYFHRESKIVMTHENYKNGKLNGIKKVFYDDGSLAEILYYSNGKREGNYKKMGVNEKMLEELNYKNNELHGQAVFYDGLGNITIEGQYIQGLKSGIWRTYANGKVIKEEAAKKYSSKNFEYTLNEKGEKIPGNMKVRVNKNNK